MTSPGSQAARWGLYQWFEEHGRHLVHAADLEAFRQLSPNGKLFLWEGMEGDYLVLRYGDAVFRVRPDLFRPVGEPLFGFGSRVSVPGKGDGVVTGMSWHFKRGEPMYVITVKGKELKKRYYSSDLSSRASPNANDGS